MYFAFLHLKSDFNTDQDRKSEIIGEKRNKTEIGNGN